MLKLDFNEHQLAAYAAYGGMCVYALRPYVHVDSGGTPVLGAPTTDKRFQWINRYGEPNVNDFTIFNELFVAPGDTVVPGSKESRALDVNVVGNREVLLLSQNRNGQFYELVARTDDP